MHLGTTGTQATFLELFDGNHDKVKELNRLVCNRMGFSKWLSVSGQTYTRKIDYQVRFLLSSQYHTITESPSLVLQRRFISPPGQPDFISHSSLSSPFRRFCYQVLSCLSGLAQSAHKMCCDIRLLASMKEVEEPFGKNQIGMSLVPFAGSTSKSSSPRLCMGVSCAQVPVRWPTSAIQCDQSECAASLAT